MYDFSVDIHKYLLKKHDKIMFGLIKKMFIILLTNLIINASNLTKCVSLSNQKYMAQPTLINLRQ